MICDAIATASKTVSDLEMHSKGVHWGNATSNRQVIEFYTHVVFPGEMHAVHTLERGREGDWSLRCHLPVDAFSHFIECDHVNGKEAVKKYSSFATQAETAK